ncbi:hypothetical protein [Metabacillus fastidiosus]|uniref:hypothetical protein n=1 Tax=Metabacillus fastidiosus TaxID=1458 RepID=UPI002DBBD9B6|nr:hypothetical protein [Metabacillus fastidiosus]MEC2077046.1 hypothetical protein [Metabacillus fastidiosus]
METQVSIDKFVIDYKDVPHSVFLRLYMIIAMKYKKIVYDPKVISDDEIIDLSKEAMVEGLSSKREIPLLK